MSREDATAAIDGWAAKSPARSAKRRRTSWSVRTPAANSTKRAQLGVPILAEAEFQALIMRAELAALSQPDCRPS